LAIAPRPEPGEQQPAAGGETREEYGEREPLAEAPGQVRRAVEAKAHERGAGLTGREAQRVRPVDSELVQPEQDRPVRKEARPEERRPHRQPRTRGWVAEGVGLVAGSPQGQRPGG